MLVLIQRIQSAVLLLLLKIENKKRPRGHRGPRGRGRGPRTIRALGPWGHQGTGAGGAGLGAIRAQGP